MTTLFHLECFLLLVIHLDPLLLLLLLLFFFFFFFFNRHYNPSWVSACSTVVEVLQSAVASGTSNPQLGFRAFQLSPQEAPSV
jgi:hypothetical protein